MTFLSLWCFWRELSGALRERERKTTKVGAVSCWGHLVYVQRAVYKPLVSKKRCDVPLFVTSRREYLKFFSMCNCLRLPWFPETDNYKHNWFTDYTDYCYCVLSWLLHFTCNQRQPALLSCALKSMEVRVWTMLAVIFQSFGLGSQNIFEKWVIYFL